MNAAVVDDIDIDIDIGIDDIDLDLIVSDDEEEDEEVVERVPKRYIRDGHDPFDFYCDAEFKRRFRFSKDSVKFGILLEIEGHLLKMPRTPETRAENQSLFRQLGYGNRAIGMPGVDGAIDCSHVRLVDTPFQRINEDLRNRKGYFSLARSAVVGPRMEIMDIVPEWPGSAHDSHIFQNSLIRTRYMEQEFDGILVGDSGYPCLPFRMTPLQNPQTDEELTYNNIHSSTRLTVERMFGMWKRRFPCLSRGLATKLVCSTSIVVACAVLHNMALQFNDNLAEEEDEGAQEEEEVPVHLPDHQSMNGLAVRQALIAQMYNTG